MATDGEPDHVGAGFDQGAGNTAKAAKTTKCIAENVTEGGEYIIYGHSLS